MEITKTSIIKSYLKIVKKASKFPTASDLLNEGIDRKSINKHFGSLNGLHDEVKANHEDKLSKNILSEDQIFTKVSLNKLAEDVKKYNKFVISTVVCNKRVNVPFFKAIKEYCRINNAKLLLIPCADVFNSKINETTIFRSL